MDSALPIGTQISGQFNTYTIERVLGQGSFGITYLASTYMKGPLGEVTVQVALKEFFAKELDSRMEDGTVTSRTDDGIAKKYARAFRQESRNLSKMKHPGIVNVFEAFDAKGTCFYSMEYLSGGSMEDKVKGSGLPEKEALKYVCKIGEALSYMHSRKMMHLDLKPKNIMLKSDGSPVIIDFGLSKQYDSSGEPESSSRIGMGTPGYAPLEQATQTSDLEFQPTLDIYALGATLYKMLTGCTPPTASEILNDGFSVIQLKQKIVTTATIEVISMSMSPAKKNRPQTVSEFLSLLNNEKTAEDTTIVNVLTSAIESQPEQAMNNRSQKVQKSKKIPSWLGLNTNTMLLAFSIGIVVVLLSVIIHARKKNPSGPTTRKMDTTVVITTPPTEGSATISSAKLTDLSKTPKEDKTISTRKPNTQTNTNSQEVSAGTSNAYLEGREVDKAGLKKPVYTSKKSGKVVVKIWVDQYGKVQKAVPGADGTTVTDKALWTAARNAALETGFTMNASAPAIQEGTITYIFNDEMYVDTLYALKGPDGVIYYEDSQYDISDNEREKIDFLIKALIDNPNKIVYIISYCANVSGTPDGNWTLSEKRATVVEQVFLDAGIEATRIKTYWHGDAKRRSRDYDENNATELYIR